jgi:hypothetical protein
VRNPSSITEINMPIGGIALAFLWGSICPYLHASWALHG